MDLLKGHLYDFASIPNTPTRTTTAFTTLESFRAALKLGDHVFYNNMKLPIWFRPHLFELSHHGVYVGDEVTPAVWQNIVSVNPQTKIKTSTRTQVRPETTQKAILHVWPGKKKDASTDLQYTSVEDFFNTALRTESAAYIIHDSNLGDNEKRKEIVDTCKEFKKQKFVFKELTNNCENFVNSCLYGNKESEQVKSYKQLESKLIKGAIAATAGVVGVGVAAKMLHNKNKTPSVTTPRPNSRSVRGGGSRHPSRRIRSRRNPSPRRNRNHKRSSNRRTPSRRTPNRRKAQKCR